MLFPAKTAGFFLTLNLTFLTLRNKGQNDVIEENRNATKNPQSLVGCGFSWWCLLDSNQ